MDDEFTDERFDDEFVRRAMIHEATAAERARLTSSVGAAQRLEAASAAARRELRRQRRRARRRSRIAVVVAVSMIAGLAWSIVERGEPTAGPLAIGTEPGQVFTFDDETLELPPPPADQGTTPLGEPAEVPSGRGTHRFVETQPGGADPVTYDPCQPLHLVVNGAAAPPAGEDLLADAVRAVSAATGLRIVVDGPTDEAPADRRRPVQPDRYGDRWAPVLVTWSTPEQLEQLGGVVAGSAGSMSIGDPATGRRYFVTGVVALDGPQLAEVVDEAGFDAARAVVAHELAHLVGLDHVDDPTQLMNPASTPGVVRFGAGDRAGLARLGRGTCTPSL